jgi:CDP-diacylglycerol--glycerol-3-phosphate 3-phosphatidyltransferase
MNWANRLTVSRLGLTMLFVLSLNSRWDFAYTAALILFVIAGITDYVDGEIARRFHYITNFGKLMDPLVDKVMIAAAFISLVALPAAEIPTGIPAWAAIVVVAREFLITGLRLMASSQGHVLPAEKLGKHKTSWQIVTVIFFLLLLAARELRIVDGASEWWARAWTQGGAVLVWTTVALTLYSGVRYAWKHRAIVATEH